MLARKVQPVCSGGGASTMAVKLWCKDCPRRRASCLAWQHESRSQAVCVQVAIHSNDHLTLLLQPAASGFWRTLTCICNAQILKGTRDEAFPGTSLTPASFHPSVAWHAVWCCVPVPQLLGVALVAVQGGLGEASALGLCSLHPNQLALTAWSSGTGFAGADCVSDT